MATKKELETKTNSVKKIKQVVRAMELIATNRLRKVKERALKSRAYSDKINEILISLLKRTIDLSHPLIEKRKNFKYFCLICLTSDRGLCGGFNNNVIQKAEEFIRSYKNKKPKLITLGHKGKVFFKQKNYDIIADYESLGKNQEFSIAEKIKDKVMDFYKDKELGEVYIIFNKFKQQFLGKVTLKKLLPLEVPPKEKGEHLLTEYICEPQAKEIISELIPEYIANQIYQASLESNAQEEMARMVAMKQASDNADDMIRQLQLQYHKIRQAFITREIIEVINAS